MRAAVMRGQLGLRRVRARAMIERLHRRLAGRGRSGGRALLRHRGLMIFHGLRRRSILCRVYRNERRQIGQREDDECYFFHDIVRRYIQSPTLITPAITTSRPNPGTAKNTATRGYASPRRMLTES